MHDAAVTTSLRKWVKQIREHHLSLHYSVTACVLSPTVSHPLWRGLANARRPPTQTLGFRDALRQILFLHLHFDSNVSSLMATTLCPAPQWMRVQVREGRGQASSSPLAARSSSSSSRVNPRATPKHLPARSSKVCHTWARWGFPTEPRSVLEEVEA